MSTSTGQACRRDPCDACRRGVGHTPDAAGDTVCRVQWGSGFDLASVTWPWSVCAIARQDGDWQVEIRVRDHAVELDTREALRLAMATLNAIESATSSNLRELRNAPER